MYKKLLLIIVFLGLVSCSHRKNNFITFEEDRLYLKELSLKDDTVEWFFYSYISSESPDYILIKNKEKEDTIAISTNVADIGLENDSIKISFYGKPMKYNKIIKVNIKKYPIKIDTTIIVGEPKYRPTYKKNK